MTAPGALVRALRDLYADEHRTRVRCGRHASAGLAESAALHALAVHAALVEESLRGFARARRLRLQRARLLAYDVLDGFTHWLPVQRASLRAVLDHAASFVAGAARVALVANRAGDREIACWALAAGRARAVLLERAEIARHAETLDEAGPVSGERIILTPMAP